MTPAASIVGVALSEAGLERLDDLARLRGITRANAASALLEAALSASKPKPIRAPNKNLNGDFALAELTADRSAFSGRDFLRKPRCGVKTLRGYVALGWLVDLGGDEYRLTDKGSEAIERCRRRR